MCNRRGFRSPASPKSRLVGTKAGSRRVSEQLDRVGVGGDLRGDLAAKGLHLRIDRPLNYARGCTLQQDDEAVLVADFFHAGWLRPGNPALDPTEDARDVYPRATEAEAAWLTQAEWKGKRVRGLDADTLYTFRARAQSGGGGPTATVVVGTYSTNKEGDVNRSGRATALDYAYIKAAILTSAAIEDAWPCNTLHTDREINGLDLSRAWDEALGP